MTTGEILPHERKLQHQKYRGIHTNPTRTHSKPYNHGLSLDQPKLKNLYMGQREGWHLQDSQGNDLGSLTLALISDTRKGRDNVQIGPQSADWHLMRGYFDVQKRSFLQEHQWLSPANADEDLRNPEEKHYSWTVAELNGKKGIGFAAFDRDKFSDGESYVKWFFKPTLRTKDKDFSGANVVLGNGHNQPLEKIIWNHSLNHVGGKNMLSVYDAPESELAQIRPYFRALAPKFDVPKVDAKTVKDYKEKADSVYIVVGIPESSDSTRKSVGIELQKAFELYHGYLREAYFPQFANVEDGKKHELTKKTEAARDMYEGGIRKLVESAVKVNGKLIVPYKDARVTGIPLSPQEITEVGLIYLMKGQKLFEHYVRYPAKK